MEKAQSSRPDLVITGLNMPNMNGIFARIRPDAEGALAGRTTNSNPMTGCCCSKTANSTLVGRADRHASLA